MSRYGFRAKFDRYCFPQKLERLGEYCGLVKNHQNVVGYIGANGYANLGDIALYHVIKSNLLNDAYMISYKGNSPLYNAVFSNHKLYQSVCLGGGTLIGQNDKMNALKDALESGLKGFSYGTGVVDPDFVSETHKDYYREFNSYIQVLNKLSLVSVRDYRSKEILIEHGLECEIYVIGDPVLSLSRPLKFITKTTKSIGINFGISKAKGSMWGNLNTTLKVFKQVVSELKKQGYQVTIYPLSWAEIDLAYAFVAELGEGVRVERRYLDINSVFASLSQEEIVVGTKLHSVIFSHCVNIPAIMLAYQPKCFSYMNSVGMDYYSIRGDLVSASLILDKINELIQNRDEVLKTITDKKRQLQANHLSFQSKLKKFLQGDPRYILNQ